MKSTIALAALVVGAARDKKTLFGIVFYGGWGTPSERNRMIAIPTIAEGFKGRAT